MAPAVSGGDHIIMEGITFLARSPRRGDIVVFNPGQTTFWFPRGLYVKRMAGLPHDHLIISEGKLYIDDKLVTLSNIQGSIIYDAPKNSASLSFRTNVVVPSGCYFLLGDNSTNSFDSRYFGCISRRDIKGRVAYCYWPFSRIGIVK